MKKNAIDAKKVLLMRIKGLNKGKGLANFQNRLRSMVIALTNKEKLISGDLAWAEKFIVKSTNLKVKLVTAGKQDVASFKKVLDLYNEVKAQDLVKAKELAEMRMKNDLAKCVSQDQESTVKDYYEHKILREIKLKTVLKNILMAEGLISKKAKSDTEVSETIIEATPEMAVSEEQTQSV